MKVLKCLQISFIYIGAIIGAGFATGREVMLYFGDGGMLSGIVAGVLMGALCGLFLLSAKSYRRLKYSERKSVRAVFAIIKSILWLCTLVSFVCMASGCEEIIENTYGIKNVGLWTGIFVSVLGVCEMSVMRKLNAVIVPMIMILLFALSAKSDFSFDSGFRAERVLGYCGMNIMMGGYIIAEQEESFSLKQIIFISGVTATFFALSIALVYNVSCDFRNFSMPVFEFSKLHDMKAVSGLIIYLAIFSTLIGCSKLICQENSERKIPKAFSVGLLAVFALLALRFDFSTLVAYCYPIIGYVGIGYTVFTLALPFALRIFDGKARRKTIKSTSRLCERS
ncbi:MAG: hypothetical protein K2N32_03475 [Clostridia bacterium]|nr:hypothetical protein [Clostridia bacterium]